MKAFVPLLLLSTAALAAPRRVDPQMDWLDNGVIRVGVDLNLGGAITWLSRSGTEENVINSFDWGRQVQMSYYSGPVPFESNGKKPAKQWQHIGWNPIQVGDDFGNPARVLAHTNDGQQLYVKCLPMQWPLDEVPGECEFEWWITLNDRAVQVRARLQNRRGDRTHYAARLQEMPAVYTNGPYFRVVTYDGDRPFTGGKISQLNTRNATAGWSRWLCTEGWSALLRADDWGLGVWSPDCLEFGGGFDGQPGVGGPRDGSCGYLAPSRPEIIDANIAHEYRFELILGTLDQIRQRVVSKPRRGLPDWTFARDRQGWYYRNASDAGWPISGELKVQFDVADPGLSSPAFFCRSEDASTLVFEGAISSRETSAVVYWKRLGGQSTAQECSMSFPIQADGSMCEYRVRLADSPHWQGAIVGLRLDPANEAGGSMRLRRVWLER